MIHKMKLNENPFERIKNEPKMKSQKNEDFQKILKGGIIRYE